MQKKICITTLGCDKNRCDSEQMAAILAAAGFTMVPDDESAQIIIVNTCAFIGSARKEAVSEILGKVLYKEAGTCEKLIVTGCLPAYCKNKIDKRNSADDLKKALPEVDLFVGADEYEKLPSLIKGIIRSDKSNCSMFNDKTSLKLLSTPPSYAYIKIGDGCNNACAYCTIPMIRGKYRSRCQSEILCEVKHFSDLGVGEFLLVAQDITKYGTDTGSDLVTLIRKMSAFPGVRRIRLHYVYPNGITDDLITEISINEKVCKYLDVPLQHTSSRLLAKMYRRGSTAEYLDMVQKLRARIPNLTLRSTFMVGFPTETDEDFQELCSFLKQAELDHVGFFAFSREPGTRAFELQQIPQKTKKERLRAVQSLQSAILKERHEKMLGKTLKVVCDSANEVLGFSIARSEGQSPEVDPHIIVDGQLKPGDYYEVRITGIKGKNLKGEIV